MLKFILSMGIYDEPNFRVFPNYLNLNLNLNSADAVSFVKWSHFLNSGCDKNINSKKKADSFETAF